MLYSALTPRLTCYHVGQVSIPLGVAAMESRPTLDLDVGAVWARKPCQKAVASCMGRPRLGGSECSVPRTS